MAERDERGLIGLLEAAQQCFPGAAEMVPGVPPSTRLGQKVLSGRSALELAFVAGRHLAWFREERFVRLLVPTLADLEDLFLAALHIGNPGLPLGADVKRRIEPLSNAIEPILEPQQIDRLRGYFLRFVEDGGRTNLQRWATAADRTAARAAPYSPAWGDRCAGPAGGRQPAARGGGAQEW